MLKSDDGRRAAIVPATLVSSVVARHAGKLVFHQYGSSYFLSEVWSNACASAAVPDRVGERDPSRRLLRGAKVSRRERRL
jgi:hypothetical protein